MNRALVVLLSALDTVLQTAVGLAVVAAPLTLLWVFGLGGADWTALWPATAAIWQSGMLVPLEVTLPDTLLAQLSLPAEGASFVVSLAPLAFATFSVIFGVRSGLRAARAGGWQLGAGTALVVSLVLTTLIALTSRTEIVTPNLATAILVPALLYTLAVTVGGVVGAWREGAGGVVGRVRERVEALTDPWPDVLAASVRGAAAACLGLLALSAIGLSLAVFLSAGRIVALFQMGNVDLMGAILLGLAQFAYLPTALVWALAWISGAGFALGEGTSISPIAADVGVVPGIPLLGAVPEVHGVWLLLVVLAPVAVGAFAGLLARAWLDGLPGTDAAGPRAAAAFGIAVLTAGASALAAVAASGSMGPGHLAVAGPHPGMVALAVGVEVFVGAAILLLGPLRSAGGAGAPVDGASASLRAD